MKNRKGNYLEEQAMPELADGDLDQVTGGMGTVYCEECCTNPSSKSAFFPYNDVPAGLNQCHLNASDSLSNTSEVISENLSNIKDINIDDMTVNLNTGLNVHNMLLSAHSEPVTKTLADCL